MCEESLSNNMGELSLSLGSLFKYLDATPSSRTVVEGEAVLKAKHLFTCGLLHKSEKTIKVFALCIRSSTITERPHELSGCFTITENTIEVQTMSCTCKAGISKKCKHISALLIKCTRENILKFEVLSSTELKCYWSKAKSIEQYKPKPLQETACIKSKPANINPLTEANACNIRNYVAAKLPLSALAKHMSRLDKVEIAATISENKLPNDNIQKILAHSNKSELLTNLNIVIPENKCCKAIYVQLCEDDVFMIATNLQQDELWLKNRQFRITGSRCYDIFTYNGKDWEGKSNKYFWPKSFTNKYVRHGRQFESQAKMSFATRNEYKVVETGLIISQKHPWLGYTPDGVICQNGEPTALLEIKCPFSGKDKGAVTFVNSESYLTFTEDSFLTLKQKHKYYGQIQLGMAVLNLKKCNFVLYSSFNDTFLNIIIDYDEYFATKMIKKLQENFFNYMIHNVCIDKENIKPQ